MNQDDFRRLLATPQAAREIVPRKTLFEPRRCAMDSRTGLKTNVSRLFDKNVRENSGTGKKNAGKAIWRNGTSYKDRKKNLQEENEHGEWGNKILKKTVPEKQKNDQKERMQAMEEAVASLREAASKGEISQAEYVAQTQRLGGDFEHAGLVRGLDRVLLARVRRGEAIEVAGEEGEIAKERVETGLKDQDEVDLDEIYAGVSKKRDSQDIEEGKKCVCAQNTASVTLKNTQTSNLEKFKPIGGEKLENTYQIEIKTGKMDTKSKNTGKGLTGKEYLPQKPPEKSIDVSIEDDGENDDFIFEDVGEYDLFESFEQQTKHQETKKSAIQRGKGERGYFTSAQDGEEAFDLVDAGSLTREAVLREDTQLIAALKKAATLDNLDEQKNVEKKKKMVDMGFGLVLGEAYEDLGRQEEWLGEESDEDCSRPKKRGKVIPARKQALGT
ncbi:hypothetical protein PMAC_003270 [Pneumocystis sp. 'macacae']|nr:hypothetical protein PMAC_003270 [Pneumocystis sp. 'macacae']